LHDCTIGGTKSAIWLGSWVVNCAVASSQISTLLAQLRNGDKQAEDALFSIVYDELRRIAARSMSGERGDHTLQTTALVHEAYLRLVRGENMRFQAREHFFAVAAQIMRRILVDHARAHRSAKRSGGFLTSLDECAVAGTEKSEDILAVDEALHRLSELDSRQAKIVEMRFFGEMHEEEIASVLGISSRTVRRDWIMAKAWLYGELAP
jgi:RNA polymerase sigma-70 factor, ECF subfamily